MILKEKEFIEHSNGLYVSMDGEVFVPKSKRFPKGHFTFGSNTILGYKRVI